MSPSKLREWFLPRTRLEVEWRQVFGKATLFPNSIGGLVVDGPVTIHGHPGIVLLLIVRTENGQLVHEVLVGWIETDRYTSDVHPKKQRVPLAELSSAQRHGGPSREVAA